MKGEKGFSGDIGPEGPQVMYFCRSVVVYSCLYVFIFLHALSGGLWK